jgi:hypothetical protein
MKRKNEEAHGKIGASKKRALSDDEAKKCFGKSVFSGLDANTKKYAQSQP